MKNLRNKLIIILIFLVAAFFIIRSGSNFAKKNPITESQAREKITTLFGDVIEKVDDRSLIITSNDDFMIMVVDDRYLLIDYATVPPTIHDYKSVKPDIEVEIMEIYEDGSFLALHDDHTHVVHEPLPQGAKVGDKVFIKDPHTYLEDRHLDDH